MKRPAQIKPWLTAQELAVWVREAPDRDAYRRRLTIWLTHLGPYHAHQVAAMLQVSTPAVWLWVGQYNKQGPEGLKRTGRGGRRWSLLSWAQEEAFLRALEERAARGEILTAGQMLPEIRKATGTKVSVGYVYRLLYRHGWRKLGPRPHHVKADRKRQEELKKNSRW